MLLSKTEICNQALSRIGAKTIMSVNDDDSKSAAACLSLWEATVSEVGRMGEWRCLRRRTSLTRLATPPAFEWLYQYQLPTDLLTVLELNGVAYHGEPQDEWEIEGNLLLTDAEGAMLRYVAYIEDTMQWDSLFANSVIVLLAAKLAVPIRQDEQLMIALMNEYQRTLGSARMRDGNERKKHRWNPTTWSRWVNSRYSSTIDSL